MFNEAKIRFRAAKRGVALFGVALWGVIEYLDPDKFGKWGELLFSLLSIL